MPDPWYVQGFGEHYLELYAHRNEREAALALGLLGKAGLEPGPGRILDLACGGGRHLAGLGRLGFRAVGLDLSEPLLREARGRLRPGLSLLRGDMRELPFRDGSLDGALSMFTSFGYFREDRDNWRMPEELARVLVPGGWFLFDFLNRRVVERGLTKSSQRESERWTALEERRIDEGRVVKQVEIRPKDGGAEPFRYEESVRLFSPEELTAGLEQRGFRQEACWGDYRGAEFDVESSPRFIQLLRR
jgi:SAM-dependent methyltransferase